MENKIKVIAELCQNHNGDFNLIEEMVHAASESGADIAKIQSMNSSDLTHREKFDNGLIDNGEIKIIKRPYKEEYERLKLLDLNKDHHYKFLELCSKYNIIPMTTIFNLGKIKFIEQANFKAVKIASYDCGSHYMIEQILKKISKNSNFIRRFF